MALIVRVAKTALEEAREAGADLPVSNQWHAAWQGVFERSGYFRGPSKYLPGPSPELAAQIGEGPEAAARMRVNRADGDGRVNL